MEVAAVFALLVLVGLGAWYLLHRTRGQARQAEPARTHLAVPPDGPGPDSPTATAGARPETVEDAPPALTDVADRIESVFTKVAHPADMLQNAEFRAAVERLCSSEYTTAQVGNIAAGANWVLSAVGHEALLRRDPEGTQVEKSLREVGTSYAFPLYFLLRYLDTAAGKPVVGRVLCGVNNWWQNNQTIAESMDRLIDTQVGKGFSIDFGEAYGRLSKGDRQNLRAFIATLAERHRPLLTDALRTADETRVDEQFLRSVGEFVAASELDEPVIETEQVVRLVVEAVEELDEGQARSLLFVGVSGVGKSAVRRSVARHLVGKGWRVFRTTGANLIAGKKFIGEIEGQVRNLLRNAGTSQKIVLYIDRLAELAAYGRSSSNDASVLDQLWPALESRRMLLLAETTPQGLQALLQRHPSLPSTMKVVPLVPADEPTTLDIADRLLLQLQPELEPAAKREVLDECMQLAAHFLTHKSLPGSVLALLQLAVARAERVDHGHVSRQHVLDSLQQISGLPAEVLDENQALNVLQLKARFEARVIGQEEAVDCLVERVAMLKAGLTDPSRPIGVFLFAGPTGTGKTEIAKTLAHLLFGSAEQMIRLDMSEYQDSDSIWRLLGHSKGGNQDTSLASRIRQKPFSVVLLDEFEKAHPKIWDVFLQVFDDGRLTDSQGDLADFRHSIIILTSNLGAKISGEDGIGFTSQSGLFSAGDVLRTVNRTFRPEFVNRLDRVIVFKPLSRDVMRAILKKELGLALARRGLRRRQWAVEWEDSALEFLLSEGFTPDLGARPLRRAIERHLLAPLSLTIVQNQAPTGEQFLFIRSNGDRLDVEFVDPDAEPVDNELAVSDGMCAGAPDLRRLLLDGPTPANGTEAVLAETAAILRRLESESWIATKDRLLAQVNDAAFWERPDRATVLDRIELTDRLESAGSALESLSRRLAAHPSNRKLIASIARRLYVVREGLADLDQNRPTQVRIQIAAAGDDTVREAFADFAQLLHGMYRAWAGARGMRILNDRGDAAPGTHVLDIAGFGCHALLSTETGLHVFEYPGRNNAFERTLARVSILDPGMAADAALEHDNRVVRRYRRHPSPLVRDSLRGWRTGRLDLVLAGNFDLFASS